MEGEVADLISGWEQRYNEASSFIQFGGFGRLSDGCFTAEKSSQSLLELAQKWNVTNDCFYIWYRGPFGIINGLRLGSEVPALPADLDDPVPVTASPDTSSITGR